MTTPPGDDLLFEVPAPPTPVERLLLLAGHYTQHNDTLDIVLGAPTPPDPDAHVTSAQKLAAETRAAIKAVTSQPLFENIELSDALVRLKQLAYMSTEAARHAPRLARELTALAPEAVIDSAARIAAETRRRNWSPCVTPEEQLTVTQCSALQEIARGHVVVTGSLDREYVHCREVRVLISTLRSLDSLGLTARTPNAAAPAFIGGTPQDRVHLTAAGTTALAAAIGLPPAATAAPTTAALPALTTTKSAVRRR